MDGVAVMVTVSPFPAVDSIVYGVAMLVSNPEGGPGAVEVGNSVVEVAGKLEESGVAIMALWESKRYS